MVFATSQPEEVQAEILATVWPVINAAFARVGDNPQGMDSTCRVLRRGIKASRKHCAGAAPATLTSCSYAL